MPSFNTAELLKQLRANIEQTICEANDLKNLSQEDMNRQPQSGKWSIAQVLEHLNSYNRYYLPELIKAINNGTAGHIPFKAVFKSGWFGNYFTNMMKPGKDGKVANKMQSPKDHRPKEHLNSKVVIDEFIKGQEELLSLLDTSLKTDIGALKVPVSISKFIKLKAGDTFRFLIAHQQRHFVQINNTLSVLSLTTARPSVKA